MKLDGLGGVVKPGEEEDHSQNESFWSKLFFQVDTLETLKIAAQIGIKINKN